MDLFQEIRTNKDFKISMIENPRIISEFNHSILQDAIVYNPNLAVEILHSNLDVDINHQDDKGYVAPQYSISRSLDEISYLILNRGVYLNSIDNFGNNSLFTAFINPQKNYDLIEKMLKMGADYSHKNRLGKSVSDYAHEYGDQKFIELMDTISK